MKTSIALAAINPTVGDLSGNLKLNIEAYLEAAKDGADIVVLPEMSLTGYPLEDLTQKKSFLRDAENSAYALIEAVKASGYKAAILFGHPTDVGRSDGNKRLVYNSATFYDPEVDEHYVSHKNELPNYGVFDEQRNFVKGGHPRVLPWRGLRIGVVICEDGWFPDVTKTLANQGADLLLWVNGSPFSRGKNVRRRELAADRVRDARVPIVYVNLAGGQDELIFDSDCFSWDGSSYVQTALFQTGVQIVTMDLVRGGATKSPISPNLPKVEATGIAEVYQAKVLGIRDYARKSGFQKVVLGMSGGIDSAIVASLCTDALGAENVLLVRLPSRFSSSGSLNDAEAAQKLLGCPMRTIAIEPAVNVLREIYRDMQVDLGPTPLENSGHAEIFGVADENLQARIRGDLLMAIANQEGYLLVTTGNRSEVSVGYFTLYGDSCGGYNLLKDTLKTDVSVAAGRHAETEADLTSLIAEFGPGLVQWRNSLRGDLEKYGFHGPEGRTVPFEIEAKAESAELAPDQKDSNSLPYYPILDGIITCLVDLQMGVDEIVEIDRDNEQLRAILTRSRRRAEQDIEETIRQGFARADVERVNKLINRAEHKRRQTAPGPKVGTMLYGRDRRMPLVNAYEG